MADQFKRLSIVLARSLKLDEESLLASFRVARLEDVASISALRRRVFGENIRDDDEIYLKWRYFGRAEYPATLWVFDYQGRVIGALGTEPVDLWYQGRMQPALRNMDAIVEPKFDSRGLGAWMTLAMQSWHEIVLVSGGNESSTSMLNKLFTALPARKNYKIIFNATGFVQSKIHHRLTSQLLAPLLNLTAMLFLRYRWRCCTVPTGLTLRHFDSVEQLLPHVTEPVGMIADIKVVRTPAYLQWRYADNPSQDYFTVALFEETELVAYVIYKYEDGWHQGATRMGQVVDWYVRTHDDALAVLSSLLIMTLKDLKRRGCGEVMLVLNDEFSRHAAKAAGFIYRYTDSTFFVFRKGALGDDPIFSESAWYHSLGDTDTV